MNSNSNDRAVEILKAFKCSSDELLKSDDEFFRELGQRIKEFNADEKRREEALKLEWEQKKAQIKILKEKGASLEEISKATDLDIDFIKKL